MSADLSNNVILRRKYPSFFDGDIVHWGQCNTISRYCKMGSKCMIFYHKYYAKHFVR